MKALRLGLKAALVLSFIVFPAMANHSWGPYHWSRCANPFNVNVGDNVTSVWDPHLVVAADDWSLSSVLDMTIVAGGTTPKSCRPTLGRVEVCNAKYGSTGWLGIAQIWASGDHVTQAVVKLNDTYHGSPPYNTPEFRQFVMCQEIGHTLGLDHQDEGFGNPNLGSCMDYTNDPSTNQHPNAHDYEQLELIYAHLDSCARVSIASAPPAMYQMDLSARGQWGDRVFRSENGRVEVYVLDFGEGHRVYTHVTRALPQIDLAPDSDGR